jgi:pimeloyl-ACP methyl ester carboxylesterase
LTSLLTGALRPEQDYRLPVPALLVHGQLDHLGDIAPSTRAWAQREPLAEYVVIPAAGHASNLDNPTAFTAALLAFLDRVLGPGAEEEPPSPTEHGEELHR